MDGHKRTLSDEMLEREIEAALGVEPSPEFLPRVRARIGNEGMQEGWFSSAPWRWTAAVAVVTAVAIIGVWTVRDPAPGSREARIATTPPNSGSGIRDSGLGSPGPNSATASPSGPIPGRVRTVRTTSRATNAAPLEVVISPDESAALRQLFTAISDRRIETRSLPDLAAALKPPDPIEEIVLEPITISPLAALEGE